MRGLHVDADVTVSICVCECASVCRDIDIGMCVAAIVFAIDIDDVHDE